MTGIIRVRAGVGWSKPAGSKPVVFPGTVRRIHPGQDAGQPQQTIQGNVTGGFEALDRTFRHPGSGGKAAARQVFGQPAGLGAGGDHFAHGFGGLKNKRSHSIYYKLEKLLVDH
ncbi:MAG: hypothetical protein MUC53_10055 [Candidatus Contendobacter sp.]|nr:hypothetical protein [Candidatus Contendobacter sp.]